MLCSFINILPITELRDFDGPAADRVKMQGQLKDMQDQYNGPNLAKIAFLLMAFGTVSYIWIKTSRALMDEIEKK